MIFCLFSCLIEDVFDFLYKRKYFFYHLVEKEVCFKKFFSKKEEILNVCTLDMSLVFFLFG